jgi:hypothetical protein
VIAPTAARVLDRAPVRGRRVVGKLERGVGHRAIGGGATHAGSVCSSSRVVTLGFQLLGVHVEREARDREDGRARRRRRQRGRGRGRRGGGGGGGRAFSTATFNIHCSSSRSDGRRSAAQRAQRRLPD